jgi:hypothetical protein
VTGALGWLDAHGRIVLAGLALFYTVLGLLVLTPQAFYSGDIGIMYAQARALVDHRFTSLNIPYPGEFLDPGREFFPMRPPFILVTAGSTQAIFSPASAVLQAAAVAVAGLFGLILLSIAGAVVMLYATRKLSPPPYGTAVAVVLGLGTPLWFHAIAGWEHAPGAACGVAGFACAVRSRWRTGPFLAGLLVGAGAILREEVLLLLPGVLIALWWRTRGLRPVAAAIAGALIPLVVAASVEVWWFQRPVAAHLRHAVHLVQSAMDLTDAPNPDVPVLEAFTLRDRYDTVVEYWLLGYGADRIIAAVAAGLMVALLISHRWRSSLGLLLWLTVVLAFAARDVWEVVTAPKWLAGLHRVSPYLVFALFPIPAGVNGTGPPGWLRPVIALTAAAYLLVAFAGVDTAGGKGLGPRLLLPLFPLLAVSAVAAIDAYLRSDTPADRWVGRAGVLLVGMAIAIHLLGAIPAYYRRNQDDSRTIRSIIDTREGLIVADNAFTAQMLLPLYYRRIILLADSDELQRKLGARLAAERLTSLILVSRRSDTPGDLAPFRYRRGELRGRMTIQYWER